MNKTPPQAGKEHSVGNWSLHFRRCHGEMVSESWQALEHSSYMPVYPQPSVYLHRHLMAHENIIVLFCLGNQHCKCVSLFNANDLKINISILDLRS